MTKLAETIVNRLLEGTKPPIPVKLRLADGSVIDAEFNGYWDLNFMGKGMVPSIGKRIGVGGTLSHGIHDPTKEEIITPIPSPEEWDAEDPASPTEPPPKACGWPTAGSGA